MEYNYNTETTTAFRLKKHIKKQDEDRKGTQINKKVKIIGCIGQSRILRHNYICAYLENLLNSEVSKNLIKSHL